MADLQSAVGGTALGHIFTGNGALVGFISNSFYTLMAIIFPMVYSIMVANRLIAEKIDKGNMTGFLATPANRLQIVLSRAAYFIVLLAAMWGIASLVEITAAHIFQPDTLDTEIFLLLNLGAFLYHLEISGICFCSSCIFNTSNYFLIFGSGIPVYFFVMSLFIKLSDQLDFLDALELDTTCHAIRSDKEWETVQRYTNATEITQRMVAGLIDHIDIYHAEKQDGVTTQHITIYYNCIGTFSVPNRRKIPAAEITMRTRKGAAVSCSPERIAV